MANTRAKPRTGERTFHLDNLEERMDDQEMYEQQQPPSVIPLSGYGEVECTHTLPLQRLFSIDPRLIGKTVPKN